MRTRRPPADAWHRVRSDIAWFLTLGAAYLATVASDAPAELCYGAIFALAGTLLIDSLQRADRRAFTLTLRTGLTLAWRAVSGAVLESALLLGPRLWAQLTGRAEPGRYIRVAIDPGNGDRVNAGRIAGVLWVQAFTPNAIPLFIEDEQLVLHQLVRRREPGAADRELPA